MGEITSLIEDVQKDKDQFAKLEQAMEPLINKYMRKLYSVCSLSNLFFRFHTTTLTEACSNELKQHHL